MGHRLWLPAVAIHRLGVVEIAPAHHHCFRTAHPCAQSVKGSPTEPVLYRSIRQRLGHLQSHLTEAGTSVRLSFQSRSLLLLADESSGVTVRMKLFRDFNLLAAGGDGTVGVWSLSFVVCVPCGRQQSSLCEEERYRPVGVHCPSSLV